MIRCAAARPIADPTPHAPGSVGSCVAPTDVRCTTTPSPRSTIGGINRWNRHERVQGVGRQDPLDEVDGHTEGRVVEAGTLVTGAADDDIDTTERGERPVSGALDRSPVGEFHLDRDDAGAHARHCSAVASSEPTCCIPAAGSSRCVPR